MLRRRLLPQQRRYQAKRRIGERASLLRRASVAGPLFARTEEAREGREGLFLPISSAGDRVQR